MHHIKKKYEKEVHTLKERNAELFSTCQNLEEELDQAMKRIDGLKEDNMALADEKDMLMDSVSSLNEINAS